MTDLTQYLKKHPRMIGVLFTILLVISNVGTVAANGSSYTGP
ncbi:DUF7503 family protein [Natronococcus pandeyae]